MQTKHHQKHRQFLVGLGSIEAHLTTNDRACVAEVCVQSHESTKMLQKRISQAGLGAAHVKAADFYEPFTGHRPFVEFACRWTCSVDHSDLRYPLIEGHGVAEW